MALYLASLDELYRTHKGFEVAYKQFEAQKQCYIPVASLALRPVHRLVHYQLILGRLVAYYTELGGAQPDLPDCKVAYDKLATINNGVKESLANLVRGILGNY